MIDIEDWTPETGESLSLDDYKLERIEELNDSKKVFTLSEIDNIMDKITNSTTIVELYDLKF